tara:strand:- start:102 stop:365 length:264 start_codon:yes stop_codon:yes gene_type:complete
VFVFVLFVLLLLLVLPSFSAPLGFLDLVRVDGDVDLLPGAVELFFLPLPVPVTGLLLLASDFLESDFCTKPKPPFVPLLVLVSGSSP